VSKGRNVLSANEATAKDVGDILAGWVWEVRMIKRLVKLLRCCGIGRGTVC